MPFAGDEAEALAAEATLLALGTEPGDALILSDNTGTAPRVEGLIVVRADGERSPARARNAGAALARTDWILFIDADCVAPPELLEAYFDADIAPDVGALAGAVVPLSGATTVAARYASERNFLRQEAHLAHSYRPRAVAANLMVRREAFEQIGGFYEGLRAAEDTDFSWRLQAAGWRLGFSPGASVQHRYRTTVRDLRRQWRGYAAGRAWLARRYEGFGPEPAVVRAAARAAGSLRRGRSPAAAARARSAPRSDPPGRVERARFLAIDALLGVDELAGFALSNRPRRDPMAPARVVLVADRFPVRDDPLVDFARTLAAARVEAAVRPELADPDAGRALHIDYREDDGAAERWRAAFSLLARHPFRTVAGLLATRGAPPLQTLAPAAIRLTRDPGARVHALGGGRSRSVAARIARLAGRELEADREL
jgi:GT2 family glycosyltransferase